MDITKDAKVCNTKIIATNKNEFKDNFYPLNEPTNYD